MYIGQKIGHGTVIAITENESDDQQWTLVCLLDARDEAPKRYVITWLKRGNYDGVIGWNMKLVGEEDLFLNAAEMYQQHIFSEPPA